MLLLEKASYYFSKKLPFALFVKPNQVQLNGVFQSTDELVEFSGQKGFVFSGFYNTKDVVLPFDSCEVIQENWSYEKQYQERISFSDSEGVEFKNLVQKGINAIVENQFEKVVLSRKIEIPNDAIDSIESFKNLVNTYSSAFRYLFYHPQIGLWMGATPEQLVKIKNGEFYTMALAGTQPYSEHIVWGEKEIKEQELVTDFIKNQIEDKVNTIKISDAITHRAGSIVHLKTDISGSIKSSIQPLDLVKALHPTSAVCGMPLQQARSFILEHEGYDRKYYSGYLGEWKGMENSDLFVNLRCCEFLENAVAVYVGCGITKDSIPEHEFIETSNKSRTIVSILVRG
ncbi:chorismate-binding protein [Flavobacterium sp.]|uniref:chorismate-binding protein n=1 Tax=Flavobacterium sp. TaxID=239 RepID=UPI0025C05775|nr:chorismate-binding protein [Flavobacterium sp.]